MNRMATNTPARKVVGSSLAAALTIILIYVIEAAAGIDIPNYVEGAVLTVMVFVTGYLTPPAAIDTVQPAGEA
ncbi:MAG: hypothetical protein AAF683_02840 [Pseudomonadota bacterium]